MSGCGVRREKAALSSGGKPCLAAAPAPARRLPPIRSTSNRFAKDTGVSIDKGLVTAQKRKSDRRRDGSQTAEVPTLLVSPFEPELNKVQYEGRIEMPNGLSHWRSVSTLF